jgi:hypothetical protein
MAYNILAERLPDLGKQSRQNLLSAVAVSAYHAQPEFPVPRLLACDDADQFKRVTEEVALCWIHEGRHYKKLDPQVAHNRQKLDDFMKRFWAYYDELLTYQHQPNPKEAERLSKAFDELFSEKTDYYWLDKRIAKTQAKKERLLIVLRHPEIPFHNNPAEIEVRRRARRRDVSFGPRTQDGKRAWDTFISLAATAKKLNVSFYGHSAQSAEWLGSLELRSKLPPVPRLFAECIDNAVIHVDSLSAYQYIHDRVTCVRHIPPLAELIAQHAENRHLGASWTSG